MVVDKCNDYGDAYALAVDNDNTLWVATKQGLLHYTDQSQSLFNSSNTSLTEDAVFDVKIDEQNNIWSITDHNLCCYNRTTFTTYPIPYSDDFLRCFDIDGKNIYVGTHQHGMLLPLSPTLFLTLQRHLCVVVAWTNKGVFGQEL